MVELVCLEPMANETTTRPLRDWGLWQHEVQRAVQQLHRVLIHFSFFIYYFNTIFFIFSLYIHTWHYQ